MRTASTSESRRASVPVIVAAAIASISLAACSSTTENHNTSQKYGAVNIVGRRSAPGQVSAAATVVAFEGVGLQVPNSSTQQNEQCVYAAADTTSVTVRGDRSAGDAVTFVVGGVTRSLPYSATDLRYATPASSPLLYRAGDIVQVTIPGNGSAFPAMTGAVKLAEPLDLGPVALPATNAGLTVTWNASNDATAAIILQLKYPNPSTSTFANEQLYCALKDDGTVTIPAALLDPFVNARSKRSITLVRWRTNLVTTGGANLHLASSTDTTFVFP